MVSRNTSDGSFRVHPNSSSGGSLIPLIYPTIHREKPSWGSARIKGWGGLPCVFVRGDHVASASLRRAERS
ncbi:unnamed protein product [Cochlearia groenlandica]